MSGSESVKLQKYVADCGLMSRRAAEERIADGSIKVNGETVELGRRIVPGTDSVTFNGKPVAITGKKRYAYIMLNKPKGYVTSMNDELGRQCVRDLTEDVGVRVYPCGRLDKDSEGLLIMTNDGDLAEKLMHPKHHIPKYYTVRVEGKITEKQLKTLNAPMLIDDYETVPAEVSIIRMTDESTSLAFTLREGRNRQIRKMCEQCGLKVEKLKRIAIGEIELGDLKSGTWRRLSRAQVDYLKNYK